MYTDKIEHSYSNASSNTDKTDNVTENTMNGMIQKRQHLKP
jgi:hypothetical protein